MASRSTRRKLRDMAGRVRVDLVGAQRHMVKLAAIADDRSKYVNDFMPSFVIAVDMVIESFDKFEEGL